MFSPKTALISLYYVITWETFSTTFFKFIYLTNPSFSVIGITETKITNPTVRKFNPSLANYQFENLNVHQPTNSSILWKRVIYVKNSLNYTVLEKNPERLSRLYGLKFNFYMTTNGCITTWNLSCVFLSTRLRSARVNEIYE